MTEQTTKKPQPKPTRVEKILGGRQPMGMILVPGEPAAVVKMVEGPAPSTEDRGRRPVPTTPAPAQPAQSPAGPGSHVPR